MSRAYYNEIDPFAAQWLRNLIDGGVIAPGDVDERDIRDVTPADLAAYAQCHFFAGIGVWSYAARLAGWPDDRNLWTGSCPCQPFSAAGKGDGFDDERHLWPDWMYLIRVSRPAVVFGEQVASKVGYSWLDLVQSDMEGLGYALGPHVSPSAGFGAPHERHRIRFAGVSLGDSARQRGGTGLRDRGPSRIGRPEPANAGATRLLDNNNNNTRLEGYAGHGDGAPRWALPYRPASATGVFGRLADSDDAQWRSDRAGGHHGDRPDARRQEGSGYPEGRGGVGGMADQSCGGRGEERQDTRWRAISDSAQGVAAGLEHGGGDCRLADANGRDAGAERQQRSGQHGQQSTDVGALRGRSEGERSQGRSDLGRPGPTNGFWGDVDWLFCRDGKWRPVEPGTFPLSYGSSQRVGRLRAYGNAVDAQATAHFIACFLEAERDGFRDPVQPGRVIDGDFVELLG